MINNGLPAIHPGEFLAETLEELGISQAQFARAIGVSPMRIPHVIKGKRPVTAELALLFGPALRQTPQYWLYLQTTHDLRTTEPAIRRQLAISAACHLPPATSHPPAVLLLDHEVRYYGRCTSKRKPGWLPAYS